MNKTASTCVGFWLLVVGGLNWGLVGLGELLGKGDSWDVVALIGSLTHPLVASIVYVLVGAAAVLKVWQACCHK